MTESSNNGFLCVETLQTRLPWDLCTCATHFCFGRECFSCHFPPDSILLLFWVSVRCHFLKEGSWLSSLITESPPERSLLHPQCLFPGSVWPPFPTKVEEIRSTLLTAEHTVPGAQYLLRKHCGCKEYIQKASQLAQCLGAGQWRSVCPFQAEHFLSFVLQLQCQASYLSGAIALPPSQTNIFSLESLSVKWMWTHLKREGHWSSEDSDIQPSGSIHPSHTRHTNAYAPKELAPTTCKQNPRL